MNWELKIVEGLSVGYQKTITKAERVLLGRDPSCDLCIPDPLLSRQHCMIEFNTEEVKVIDLGSRNGTFVNGQKIQEMTLQPDDKIKIGKNVIEVTPIGDSPASDAGMPNAGNLLCGQCGQPISTQEAKQNKFLRHGGKTYCEKCVHKGIDRKVLSQNTQRMVSARKPTTGAASLPANIPLTSPGLPSKPVRDHDGAPGKHMPKRIGQYEVLAILGEGGMGIVYKARHSFLETTVAIKVIKEEMAVHGDILKRFLQEAKLGINLDHPHIIRIYDAGEHEGMYFISMEYFEGKDIHSIVKKNGPLSYPQLLKIAIQIADALDYAHKRGVIHRDVKPSNIMITDNLELSKLTDFGLAKAWQATGAKNLTASGQTLGTIQYISPEQLEDSRQVDPQTDIFSLGASLYFTLCGKPPFGEEPIGKVIQNILHGDPPVLPNVPPAFDAILRKSMEKSRQARFATMEDFKNAMMELAI